MSTCTTYFSNNVTGWRLGDKAGCHPPTNSLSDSLAPVFLQSAYYVDRFSLSWGSGRGLLEVDWGWTDAASAGDQEEVY